MDVMANRSDLPYISSMPVFRVVSIENSLWRHLGTPFIIKYFFDNFNPINKISLNLHKNKKIL